MKIAILLSSLVAVAVALGTAHPFQFEPRWFLPTVSDSIGPKTMAAILEAACDGKVEGHACDTCPGSDQPGGGWTLRTIRTGHFLSAASQDAMLTIDGCNFLAANGAAGMLLTKREGEWKNLDYSIALETDRCRKMKFSSGRDLLVCELQGGGTYFHERSLLAIFAEADAFKLKRLLVAGDTTLNCSDDAAAQMALIRSVEFRDLNGDGKEDVVITADFGRMKMTPRRIEQCKAAWEDYIHQPSHPKKHPAQLPDPPVVKTYTIQYLFDGKNFRATPESAVGLRLFEWER